MTRKKKKSIVTKRIIQKQAVERGLEHFTKSGKKINGKKFSLQVLCRCALKIDALRQNELFDAFYSCHWSSKTAFLRSCVRRESVKSTRRDFSLITPQNQKEFHLTFHLIDRNGIENEVCRWFFFE